MRINMQFSHVIILFLFALINCEEEAQYSLHLWPQPQIVEMAKFNASLNLLLDITKVNYHMLQHNDNSRLIKKINSIYDLYYRKLFRNALQNQEKVEKMNQVKDFGKNLFNLIYNEQPKENLVQMKTGGLSIGINITNITDLATENYTLSIDINGNAVINSIGYTGFLRGFSTLVQCIVFIDNNNTYQLQNLPIQIEDYPRLKERGFMIDCVNSFIVTEEIKEFIDAMMFHKLNILVLKLAGNQAIRLKLSNDTQKQPYLTYSDVQLMELSLYAQTRGVQLVPGMESQTNMQWASSLLGAQSVCDNVNNKQAGELNLKSETTKDLLEKILKKFVKLFNSELIYVGGRMDQESSPCPNSDIFEGRSLTCDMLFKIDPKRKCFVYIDGDHETVPINITNSVLLNAYGHYNQNKAFSQPTLVMDIGLSLHHGILPFLNNSYNPATITPWASYNNQLNCNLTNNCIGSLIWFEYASSGHLQENAWIRGTVWSEVMWNIEPKAQNIWKEKLQRLAHMERRLLQWNVRSAPFTCEYCTLNLWDCF